ncbi:MAG: gfo/Idh/MocA family oxidoreductase [Actinobacteria bacterium]|nr:gfo/Idh/MocA family oxidoreductase [Actinomycetota bacterium]
MRGAVLGLGMIGRHHARILASTPQVDFAGAVDPSGDVHGAVIDPDLVFASVDELLASGPIDFAVVAVPTEEHLAAVRQITQAGASVLVEKPIAASAAEGLELIEIVEAAGVKGAVGHVERCNPALIELRKRINDGQLGELFLIVTERVGPFPDRIRDVGVVKDLATHDLDLVRWLGGSPIASLAGQTQNRMGRPHEDLVLINGALTSGVSFNSIVDWLSPTKVRRTRVLGDRGMLVADTLTADLTFYENGAVGSEWGTTQSLRGVSEGDVTRYAIARREPLRVQLDRFLDLLAGAEDSQVVTLAEGLETLISAEAVLASAASGQTVAPSPAGS